LKSFNSSANRIVLTTKTTNLYAHDSNLFDIIFHSSLNTNLK